MSDTPAPAPADAPGEVVMPEWAAPLIGSEPWPAFVSIRGGRSSGKTLAVARAIVLRAAREPVRVMCCRAVQRSLGDSARPEITRAIRDLRLDAEFEIGEESIRSRSGAEVRFHGLGRSQWPSLRGWANVSVTWVEEAQSVSEAAWGELLPTVQRAPGSSVIATWNPIAVTDWIWRRTMDPEATDLVIGPIVASADNPSWPGSAERHGLVPMVEARSLEQRALRLSPRLHRHVWGGMPDLGDPSSRLLTAEMVEAAIQCWHLIRDSGGMVGRQWPCEAGLDPADGGEDLNAVAIRRGPVIERVAAWQAVRHDPAATARRTLELVREHRAEAIHVDATGIGSGVVGSLVSALRDGAGWQWDGPRGIRLPAVQSIRAEQFGAKVAGGAVRWQGVRLSDHFRRRGDQLGWGVRVRAENSLRLVDGDRSVQVEECLALDPRMDGLDDVIGDLQRPEWAPDAAGKIEIDKAPGGAKSPDRFDAIRLSMAQDPVPGCIGRAPVICEVM